jgi:hypothetical protein
MHISKSAQRVIGVICALCAAIGVLYAYVAWRDGHLHLREGLLRRDIEQLSTSGTPGPFISQFDYICFGVFYGHPKENFDHAATQIGEDFSRYDYRIADHCTAMDRDVDGVVGLVRKAEVECVGINRFGFLLGRAGDLISLCARPSNLRVTRETATNKIPRPGVYSEIGPGNRYFKISAKQ